MPKTRSLSISGVQVDEETMDFVGTVVDAMKERSRNGNAHISGYDLWSDISKEDPRLGFAHVFGRAQNHFVTECAPEVAAAMEKTMPFVIAIAVSIQEFMSNSKTITANRMGRESCGPWLLSLPNEILAVIIELAALEREPGFGALELSHVCQRFRSIALHLPKIWTRMSYEYYGFNIARLYAERGHHAGLDVTVNELNHDCSKLMQAAIPFCEEWRSFSYTGFHSTLDSWHLREHRIPMKLPRLEHLQVGNDSDGVYKSYYMPNLTSALFINTIPSPTFLSTITKFAISFDLLDEDFGADLEELIEFLMKTPSIRDLSFKVRDRFYAFDAVEFPDWDRTFQNIETFSLDVGYKNKDAEIEDFETLRDFLNSLEMPNISHMNLCVKFGFETSKAARKDLLVFEFLPCPETHPKLTSLDLTVVDMRGKTLGKSKKRKSHNDLLVLDVDYIPNLKCFTLKTNFEFYLLLEDDKPYFPLRRLELNHCPRLTNGFLADVYLGLNRDGNWENFEGAVVRGCPRIKMNTGFLNGVTEKKIRTAPVSTDEIDPLGYNCFDL